MSRKVGSRSSIHFLFCFESVFLPQWRLYLEILKSWPPTLVKERNDDADQTPASLAEVFKATLLWKAPV